MSIVNSQYMFTWTEARVTHMEMIKKLNYAFIRIFSLSWPPLDEIRKFIPLHCGTKSDSIVGYFCHRKILIKYESREYFVNIGSKLLLSKRKGWEFICYEASNIWFEIKHWCWDYLRYCLDIFSQPYANVLYQRSTFLFR